MIEGEKFLDTVAQVPRVSLALRLDLVLVFVHAATEANKNNAARPGWARS